mmetsp:Transcript_1283/g.1874  ORF Transcript_1283/g.1874 Transcript_1283/m.1874 type:complete len:263 (+) Transcript_1283:1-789(+)
MLSLANGLGSTVSTGLSSLQNSFQAVSLKDEAPGGSAKGSDGKNQSPGGGVEKPKQMSKEELNQKMQILMKNPVLWKEFQQRLAKAKSRTGASVQVVLREFLNEEVDVPDDMVSNKEESSRPVMRRLSLLEVASSFAAEVKQTEAPSNNRRGSNPKPAMPIPQATGGGGRRSSFSTNNFLKRFALDSEEIAEDGPQVAAPPPSMMKPSSSANSMKKGKFSRSGQQIGSNAGLQTLNEWESTKSFNNDSEGGGKNEEWGSLYP